MILVIFIISISAVSVVNAADNATIAVDNLDNTNDNLVNAKEDIKIDNDDSSYENDEVLTLFEENSATPDEDILSGLPYYDDYEVSVSDMSYNYGNTASIKMSISPAVGFDRYYMFDLYVIDSNDVTVINQHYLGEKYKTSEVYSISSEQLEPGTYTIKIRNSLDKRLMDSAKLTVKSVPYSAYSVSVSDVSMIYGSTGSIKMSISSASSSYTYRYDFYLKVFDSNDEEKISQRYYSRSSSSSRTYSISKNELTSGLYTIKIINTYDKRVMDIAKLSIYSVPNSAYSVSVSDTSMYYGNSGSIKMTISPASSYNYKYDFYLKVYDSKNVEKISKRYYSTTAATSKTYTIEANALSLGVYTIKILNNGDDYVMSTATLAVKSVPYSAYSVRVSDVSLFYGSSGSIIMSITPASSYPYKYDYYLKVYDSNDNEKISQRYYSTSSAYSKTYNLNARSLYQGVYTIKIINYQDNHVMSTAKLYVTNIILETQDITGNCDGDIVYKVRVSDNGIYKSGLNVSFICNGNEYFATTDDDGYATLKIHLKSGSYSITTKCGNDEKKNNIIINSVYVENQFRNLKINPVNAYYKQHKNIYYSFEGNLQGSFKIYKGKSLKYSKDFNTNGYIGDYFKYPKHSYSFAMNNLKETGVYTIKIVDSKGKLLAKSSFRIDKAPTISHSESYTTLGGYKDSIWAYTFDKNGHREGITGKAKFKIGKKVYKTKVKNGFAIIKLKLPSKKKTYKCSFKFSGDKNHKKSTSKFRIKVVKIKNPIKLGKYKIKLTSKQYKKLAKAILKEKYLTLKIKTDYTHKVKKPYIKTVKKYKTTKSCKTFYGVSYLATMRKMWYNGWQKVSEYTYTVKNPQNRYGIGLSAYTYAITKWVKVSYKNAYKTKYYPVKAKIVTQGDWMAKPKIKIYSHGKTLRSGFVKFG
ncbi:hypothetical protein [Methanobrevibacter sp.]|uniref:hypothetical protein n=1 Tax=Methanobrevibacter sp. TaxID=66852 RepID=UPI00386EC9C8